MMSYINKKYTQGYHLLIKPVTCHGIEAIYTVATFLHL